MNANLFVHEEWTEVKEIDLGDDGWDRQATYLGDSDVYESFTNDKGQLFRALRKEHGRCTGHVYIDGPDGKAIPIGWVFQKRQKYQDSNETYLQETWATIHTAPPTRRTEYHYA